MQSQLNKVIKIFNELGMNYWIDCGSLLGLIRDGKLISHDEDIDIAMWDSDPLKVRSLISKMLSEKYKVEKHYYKNRLYKIIFRPKKRTQKRKVDVSFYPKEYNYAWCPTKILKKYDFKKCPFKWLLNKIITKVLLIYKRYKKVCKISIDKWPWKSVMDIRTFVVPREFFLEIVESKELGVNIPKRYPEYLTYRYGEWRTPVEKWKISDSNKSFIPLPPDEIEKIKKEY